MPYVHVARHDAPTSIQDIEAHAEFVAMRMRAVAPAPLELSS